jgi:hypothetical protein
MFERVTFPDPLPRDREAFLAWLAATPYRLDCEHHVTTEPVGDCVR